MHDTFHLAILTSACEPGLCCGKELLAFAQSYREKVWTWASSVTPGKSLHLGCCSTSWLQDNTPSPVLARRVRAQSWTYKPFSSPGSVSSDTARTNGLMWLLANWSIGRASSHLFDKCSSQPQTLISKRWLVTFTVTLSKDISGFLEHHHECHVWSDHISLTAIVPPNCPTLSHQKNLKGFLVGGQQKAIKAFLSWQELVHYLVIDSILTNL